VPWKSLAWKMSSHRSSAKRVASVRSVASEASEAVTIAHGGGAVVAAVAEIAAAIAAAIVIAINGREPNVAN
jgi:hypothetical protein